ncbi:hypothetical protein [Chamaesiphon sp. OTE_8_metabat_110]|nr:hypothetical protein [Chamaesiphon sp. OTE_8_metabat_110]
MNPEKFKQIITDHFKTVTPEEFLENLRKSSPYLFTEDSEKQQDDRISESDLPVDRINPTPKSNLPRVPGQDKGKIIIFPDFDDPLPADILAESANLGSEISKNTELYQQAKQEIKLEIAPKLLKKGMSIQEVAELLELDVQLLAQ